jgi:hypothetical protein
LVVPPVVILVIALVALHVRPSSTTGVILLYLIVVMLVVPLELLGMRYAAYDRLRAGFQVGAALRAMRGHWVVFARALAWAVCAAVVLTAARQLGGLALGASLNSDSVIGPVLAGGSPKALLALGAGYVLTVATFVNALVVAHLLGQVGAFVYPREQAETASASTLAAPAHGAPDTFDAWATSGKDG